MGNYTFEHLNSINLKHYSHSNDHLCQTTNAESAQTIPVQSLLPNATGNHLFWLPNEKNLSKTITTKLYPVKQCKKHNEECIKNKHLKDNMFSIANLYGKVCLMSTQAEQFMKSYKIMWKYVK